MHRTIGLHVVILLILLGTAPAIDAGEAELGRVKSEWPAAARRLDAMFARVRGTARIWREKPRTSAKVDSILTEAHFAIDHNMEKVELLRFTRDSRPRKLGEVVYCVGEGTAFEPHRPANAKGYTVRGIGTTGKEGYRYLAAFGRFVMAHNGVAGLPMARFLDSPGLEITAAETLDQGGKILTKVECMSGSGATKSQISFVLDPDAGWTVRSCRFHPSNNPADLTAYEVEYDPSRGGVPLPRRVKLDMPGGVVHHCEFTDWTFAPTPISEFNMAHYGLPDLVHAARPRNTLPYWLAGIAVLVGAIAIVLWRLASRGPSLARA